METWQIFLTIVGLVISAITAFGVFYGPRLVAKRQEKSGELRAHFEELRADVLPETRAMISHMTEWQRKINTYDSFVYTSAIEIPDPSDSFRAHFPEEAKDYSQYKEKISKHIERYEQFRGTIKDDFKSKGIPMVGDLTNEPVCVYDTTFVALFRWWKELVKHVSHPQPNFTQIEAEQADGGYYLYASGLGAFPVAYAKTDPDKDKLGDALVEVAQNKKYKDKTAELLNSFESLRQELSNYRKHLDEKLKDIEGYWPGTKSYKFKKETKRCTRCKEIFG